MSFWGKRFTFDDTPCEAYELMMYDIGEGEEDFEMPGVGTIVEETVGKRWRSFYYGQKFEDKLTFQITFGPNEFRIDTDKFMDKTEVDAVASWMIGHSGYKWLEIEQDDMTYIRFRCIVTELSCVNDGKVCWGMRATVTCDSPYGYMYPQIQTFDVSRAGEINISNESSVNDYYYPKLVIEGLKGDLMLTTACELDRHFILSDIPAGTGRIIVDNDNMVLQSEDGLNLYKHFNFTFLRLHRGYNKIYIEGSCRIQFICEFPVNVGG